MIRVITFIVIVFGFILAYVKYIESRGIYFPLKEIEFTPNLAGLAFEDIYINSEDGLKLNAWFIPQSEAKYTILFCHGNAGNIGHRLDKISLLHKLGLNILIIDYRGYGRSQGRPTEAGLYLDAQAAYDYLINARRLKGENIILFGESLGSAVVIQLAAEKKVRALIVEGGFTRGREMAKRIYPFLPSFLFTNSFDSLNMIKAIDVPKLFLHSREDEVVPFSFAQRLYEASSEPKQFAELEGGHNSAYFDAQEKYIAALSAFITGLSQE